MNPDIVRSDPNRRVCAVFLPTFYENRVHRQQAIILCAYSSFAIRTYPLHPSSLWATTTDCRRFVRPMMLYLSVTSVSPFSSATAVTRVILFALPAPPPPTARRREVIRVLLVLRPLIPKHRTRIVTTCSCCVYFLFCLFLNDTVFPPAPARWGCRGVACRVRPFSRGFWRCFYY